MGVQVHTTTQQVSVSCKPTTPQLQYPRSHIISGASGEEAASGRRRRRSNGRGSSGTRCPARTQRRCRRRWRRGAGRPASGGPRPWAGRGAPARTTGGTPAPARRNPAPSRTTTGRSATRPCSRASRCQPAKLDGEQQYASDVQKSICLKFQIFREAQDKLCTTIFDRIN